MLLPGPEAQQFATHIGWLTHKARGGIVAGGLFIAPGVIAIMPLSYVYAAFGNVGFVAAMLFAEGRGAGQRRSVGAGACTGCSLCNFSLQCRDAANPDGLCVSRVLLYVIGVI